MTEIPIKCCASSARRGRKILLPNRTGSANAVAHVYGSVRIIDDHRELASILTSLAVQYEAGASDPWKFEESTGPQRLAGIVGFELVSTAIEVKFKLNQNHPVENVMGAIEALAARPDENSRTIADLMRAASTRRRG